MEIEVDENGTLDLSMKKPIKKEGGPLSTSPGMRSPALSSSSSLSGHHGNTAISPHLQAYKQEEWEGPLDYTKPNRQREEELEEVRLEAFWTHLLSLNQRIFYPAVIKKKKYLDKTELLVYHVY